VPPGKTIRSGSLFAIDLLVASVISVFTEYTADAALLSTSTLLTDPIYHSLISFCSARTGRLARYKLPAAASQVFVVGKTKEDKQGLL
jgi:hypothetical protein